MPLAGHSASLESSDHLREPVPVDQLAAVRLRELPRTTPEARGRHHRRRTLERRKVFSGRRESRLCYLPVLEEVADGDDGDDSGSVTVPPGAAAQHPSRYVCRRSAGDAAERALISAGNPGLGGPIRAAAREVRPRSDPWIRGPLRVACHSSLRIRCLPETRQACWAWNQVKLVLGNTPGMETAYTPGVPGSLPGAAAPGEQRTGRATRRAETPQPALLPRAERNGQPWCREKQLYVQPQDLGCDWWLPRSR